MTSIISASELLMPGVVPSSTVTSFPASSRSLVQLNSVEDTSASIANDTNDATTLGLLKEKDDYEDTSASRQVASRQQD